ncbi:class I SAM-dependent methyltransferase [Kitasatospora sp. NPDC127121]|uniref:class I SAM-dependent methyltransferase n=1 Tax=Kitasatospora sp. NPDC127121 TaxID=3345371 RepID=UPI00363D57EA
MLVSARSFDEYRAMFALTDGDLAPGRRILDCPGGAAAFTAEAGRRGIDAVAVDREYAHHREDLGVLVERETRHKRDQLVREASDFVWTWYGDPDRLTRQWIANARDFQADIAARPDRYVAGSLPELPFADYSFDLVLSSHLLFSYGNRLDGDFHLAALLELARIARREVRLFPVMVYDTGVRYGELDGLRHHLDALGIPSHVERVEYEFQPGDNELLVLSCADYRPLARAGAPGAGASMPGASVAGASVSGAADPVRWRHRENP